METEKSSLVNRSPNNFIDEHRLESHLRSKKEVLQSAGLFSKTILRIVMMTFLLSMISVHSLAQLNSAQNMDVPYEPAPQKAVLLMLQLAKVQKGDIVYDLGCGDGRIVITAARLFGATGIGIEIDSKRLAESREKSKRAGVENQVSFRKEDLFQANIREASVVTLFLSRAANLRLLPKLLKELRPGTRVVSFYWDMDDWKPEKRIEYNGEPIYLWTIPANNSSVRDRIDKVE